MILNFTHKGLEDFFYDSTKRGIQPRHAARLETIWDRLDDAHQVEVCVIRAPTCTRCKVICWVFGRSESQATGVSFFALKRVMPPTLAIWITTKLEDIMRARTRPPVHPGMILKQHYLDPLDTTIAQAAKTLGVSRKTLSKIVHGRGAVTPDMALRLSTALRTTPELWLNLQRNYDLWQASRQSDAWRQVPELVPAE